MNEKSRRLLIQKLKERNGRMDQETIKEIEKTLN